MAGINLTKTAKRVERLFKTVILLFLLLPSVLSAETVGKTECTAAIKTFFQDAKPLLEKEIACMQTINDIWLKVETVHELKKKSSQIPKEKAIDSTANSSLERLAKVVDKLEDEWEVFNVADDALKPLKDTKVLKIKSIDFTINEMLRYLKSYDPSSYAYSKEHLRQSKLFDTIFERHVSDYCLKKSSNEKQK